jgi:phage terminase Nu1 subunit (DNA packaging protein)
MADLDQTNDEDEFDLGWDLVKYDCWWQDPNYRPDIVNKSEMAQRAEVSLTTIDAWIRQGAPIHKRGSNGIGYEISVAPFLEWQYARQQGISISEYRRRQLEDVQRYKEQQRVRGLELENKRLKRDLRKARSELR